MLIKGILFLCIFLGITLLCLHGMVDEGSIFRLIIYRKILVQSICDHFLAYLYYSKLYKENYYYLVLLIKLHSEI
jgi:hypothetical protein